MNDRPVWTFSTEAEQACTPVAPDALLAAAAAGRLRAVACAASRNANGGPSSGSKRGATEQHVWEEDPGPSSGTEPGEGAAEWEQEQFIKTDLEGLKGDVGRGRNLKRQRLGESSAKALPTHCSRPGIPAEADLNSFRVLDRPSPPFRADDKDGHYRYEPGENISTRYKILSKLGEGTFGRVLECWDRKHKDYVAIKIVRNVQKYRDAAMIELEVLNTLMWNDPNCHWHCVGLREWFNYRGHVCMVFEKLGPSLYDFLRKNRYRPFPMAYVRSFGLQLIESVAYLHTLSLVHTDLKPENILLVNNNYKKLNNSKVGKRIPETETIRLIDFGSATFEDQYHSSIVSTRHYRAPEVILGLGWSYPCDMWSIGCILVELLTGDALFQTHENLEHLAMMEAVLGPLPEHMIAQASRHSAKYFYKQSRLYWPEGAISRDSERVVRKMKSLEDIIRGAGELDALQNLYEPLLELLRGLLRYEPSERLTATEALKHSFFSENTHDVIQTATVMGLAEPGTSPVA